MNPRSPAVGFVLVCVFLDVLGVGLIIPVLPSLVGQFTADAQHQSYWYGALVASYGLMQFVFSPVLGALSDRLGRRPVLLVSITGLGIDFAVMAFADSLAMLLAARLVGGITAATMSVSTAYIADITPPEARGRGFGLLGAAFGMGFIVGPLLGGVLGAIDLRWPFLAASALALVNALYGGFVLPESLPAARRMPFSLARANPISALHALGAARGVSGLLWVFALMVLSQFILHSTWVLTTGLRFGWGPRDTGLSLFAVGVAATLVQGVLLGPLIARMGERRLVVAGLASTVLAYIGYAVVPQGWMVYPIILVNLPGMAVGPSLQTLISTSFDPQRQGLAMGALNGINGIVSVVAPLVGTALFAQVAHLPASDPRTAVTLWAGAVLQLAACLLAVREGRRHRRP